jgi:DnaJ like chaperone protein
MSYQKWVGAGLGWVVMGSPLGAIVGFGAGKLLESGKKNEALTKNTTDFETNLLLLSATLIKTEKGVTFAELNFIRSFFENNFNPDFIDEKMSILNHFLQKKYDEKKACTDILSACPKETIYQIIHFLFDLAEVDKPISNKERDCIFTLGCYMNVSASSFLAIEKSREPVEETAYDILGISPSDSLESIRSAYRKLILKYHPDKHPGISIQERKSLEERLLKIKQSFDKIVIELSKK